MSEIHLVNGADPSLVSETAQTLVDRLVGDADRTLVVADLSTEDYTIADLVDALQTPPFLTDFRVVIARGVERFTAADLDPLLAYLGDPLDTTRVVFMQGGGRINKKLADAVAKAKGTKHAVGVPTGRARDGWVAEKIDATGLRIDAAGRRLLSERLGEDMGRIGGILGTLGSIYGPGSRLSVDEIEPYLGESGAVPPWTLTDAIDQGDVATALDAIHRMMGSGDRHPLQIMASLHAHYTKMLRLDGANVRSKEDAAALLGGSPFPAGKALNQARKLGHEGVARAVHLLARADLDLRGMRSYPGDISNHLVMELLITRLARL